MIENDDSSLTATHPLAQRIANVQRLQPDQPAIEFDGHWISWGRLDAASTRIAELAATPELGQRGQIGILLRNRPEHIAAFLGVLATGGCVVVINPDRGDDRTRADIAELDLPLIIGSAEDLAGLVAPSQGTATVTLAELDTAPRVTPATRPHTLDTDRHGVAVRMLTSGTTGPPKRIDLSYDMLAHSIIGADFRNAAGPEAPRQGVAIVNAPLVHLGGVFRVLQCVTEARPFVLLARFELQQWAEAVRTHRPGAASLVPAALRTVLHSDLGPDDLSSLRAVTSGTAPLSADDADAFFEKFGIPVLTSYAATEFGGGVAGWTLADHKQYWQTKRGSVGRASPGSRLRVIDDDGAVLGPDQVGLLEVVPGQLGPAADWIRTTDIARIDADGFLWILGRADQAIIRGGFKIIPDDVRTALENHPAVLGASVVALDHERLGQTPVAMVELRNDTQVTTTELNEHLRTRLARYEIPTDIAVVDAIPRTPSGKPDLTQVRQHWQTAAAAGRDHQ